MKFENTEVFNFAGAIRGMRNPLESWDKSGTFTCFNGSGNCEKCRFYTKDADNFGINEGCLKEEVLDEYKSVTVICENDLELMQKLIRAGSEHRKFMRQIIVSVDITAPLYWWKEFDTYKIGTVANSTSTMHKLASTPITMDCFEHNKLSNRINCMAEVIQKHRLSEIDYLERLRKEYNNCVDKDIKKEIWKALIEDLPESWLQTRTVTMNYENLLSMVHQRKNHKLTEWSIDFINWVKTLPYANELLFLEKGE